MKPFNQKKVLLICLITFSLNVFYMHPKLHKNNKPKNSEIYKNILNDFNEMIDNHLSYENIMQIKQVPFSQKSAPEIKFHKKTLLHFIYSALEKYPNKSNEIALMAMELSRITSGKEEENFITNTTSKLINTLKNNHYFIHPNQIISIENTIEFECRKPLSEIKQDVIKTVKIAAVPTVAFFTAKYIKKAISYFTHKIGCNDISCNDF